MIHSSSSVGVLVKVPAREVFFYFIFIFFLFLIFTTVRVRVLSCMFVARRIGFNYFVLNAIKPHYYI